MENRTRSRATAIVSSALSVAVITLNVASAVAQTPEAQAAAVTHGHHHLNVTSVADHKRFWVEFLGDKLVKIGATENVLFPGVIVRLRASRRPEAQQDPQSITWRLKSRIFARLSPN